MLLQRLLRSAWPPLVALIASLAVFFGVLVITPPGLPALGPVLAGAAGDPAGITASYATGAAASLALLTLAVLGPTLAVIDLTVRSLSRRRGG